MIPLMSINLLLLFDNLNSATPCKIKTRHKTERSVLHTGCLDCAKKERNDAGALIFALSFPTTLFSISFIYLFRLPVLSEMGVNFRDRPRVYFTLMEENIQKLYM